MKPDGLGLCQLPTMHTYVHLASEAQQMTFPLCRKIHFSFQLKKLMVQQLLQSWFHHT